MTAYLFFHEHPVFRYDEFVSWKQSQGTTASNSIHSAIKYYLKQGRIIRIRQGLFAVVPPNEKANELFVDPYLIAAKLATDSVLAYHTALELYGVAYSAFRITTFLSSEKVKPFEYAAQRFQTVAIPKPLRDSGVDNGLGIIEMQRQGISIRVTSLERTFVDVLDRVDLCGGWEEIHRSLNNITILNVDAVIQYCLKLNYAILAAKVGYFLEQRQGVFSVPEQALNPLLELKPSTPQYLSSRRSVKSHLIKKWNLIVPLAIHRQNWEEPNHDDV